jgi:thiosulfate dehydrogenase [quinone] large subunit
MKRGLQDAIDLALGNPPVERNDPEDVAGSSSQISVEVDLSDGESRSVRLKRWLSEEFSLPAVHVVPLRLFIGIGWMRAGLEKTADTSWYDGSAIRSFLHQQLESGAISFEFHEWLANGILDAIAMPLGWALILVQLVIGVAIFFGTYTNLALLVGVYLNVNFMALGVISPSAFYIVIQVVLFVFGAGAVFGFDRRWRASSRSVFLFASTDGLRGKNNDRRLVIALAGLFMLMGIGAGSRATDVSPTGVDDPALVLSIVMIVSGITMLTAVAHRIRFSEGEELSELDRS